MESIFETSAASVRAMSTFCRTFVASIVLVSWAVQEENSKAALSSITGVVFLKLATMGDREVKVWCECMEGLA